MLGNFEIFQYVSVYIPCTEGLRVFIIFPYAEDFAKFHENSQSFGTESPEASVQNGHAEREAATSERMKRGDAASEEKLEAKLIAG